MSLKSPEESHAIPRGFSCILAYDFNGELTVGLVSFNDSWQLACQENESLYTNGCIYVRLFK